MASSIENLPVEITEEIFRELSYNSHSLLSLGLTCHTLLARTRRYAFPTIALHDQNFEDFMGLTYETQWNSILPYIRNLALGTKMFSLSKHSFRSPTQQNRDLSQWASQFQSLQSLHLCGPRWSELPQYLKDALLNIDVVHLDVCIDSTALKIEDFTTTIVTGGHFQAISISMPIWLQFSIPKVPFETVMVSDAAPFYMHHVQLYEAKPLRGLVDWLRTASQRPLIIHLFINLPEQATTTFAELTCDFLELIAPVHLHLKLPMTSKEIMTFPSISLSKLETLQFSSIYNEAHHSENSNPRGLGDTAVICATLKQIIPFQHQLRRIQMDSICSHLNLTWGDIPEIIETSFPSLKELVLTVRSGPLTKKENLDTWLNICPFSNLRSRGVCLEMVTRTGGD